MTPRVLIRADAGIDLGAGHVVRCLALAEAWRARGARVSFACRVQPGDRIDAVRAAGFQVLSLPGSDAPVDEAADADALLALLSAAPPADTPDWVVSDHYRLGAAWQQALRRGTGARIGVICGQADRPHDADWLLDPVGLPGSEARWAGLLPPTCETFIGPAHAPLRAAFRAARALPQPAEGQPHRLFVGFGGTDAPGATGRVLQALTARGLPSVAHIDAVVGDGCPHADTLAAWLADGLPRGALRPLLHRQPPDLATLMRRAHLAVSAGGGMLLELCALQVPTLVVTIADNQRAGTAALANAGCAEDLGPLDTLDDARLADRVAALAADPARRAAMRAAQSRLMRAPQRSATDALFDPPAAVRRPSPLSVPHEGTSCPQ